jgi:hypothetical protein
MSGYCSEARLRTDAEFLAIDGEHIDELPAGEPVDALYKLLGQHPILGWARDIGNWDAYIQAEESDDEAYLRYKDEDLACAKPDANGNSEQRRKHELVTDVYTNRRLILSRHGSRQNEADFAFCHPQATRLTMSVLSLMGLHRVVYYGNAFPTPDSYFKTYLGLDIGQDSPLTASVLHSKLDRLTHGETLPPPATLERYACIGGLTMKSANRFGLPTEAKPFSRLSKVNPKLCKHLGLPPETIFISGSRKYAHTGYYGELGIRTS